MNEADLASFVLACRMEGLPVVAKVPECSRTHVAKLLECGVLGIQLPWTESREQINRLVSYVKFPPLGIRAAAPGMGNCDYNLQTTGRDLIDTGNRETVVLAHVETRTGIESLDAILGNPQVDVLFLGMYVPNAQGAEPWIAKGMRFFETASEVDLIDSGARRTVAQFRSLRV
jgi:2-keto-3-deoxy-L-rhamnonate aldolase RhmA